QFAGGRGTLLAALLNDLPEEPSSMNPLTWYSLICLSFPPFAATKPATQPDVVPGHSMHGESFNEGPRQQAYLMGGTGNVHLPVTTQSADAQLFFDQGVGQLHGFWYFEAERSFRQVALLDPDCAMA